MFKVVLSALILCFVLALHFTYDAAQGPIEGSIAVMQLEDNDATYAVARKFVTYPFAKTMINIVGGALVLAIWVPVILRKACLKED